MKRTYFILLLAAAALAGCSKESSDPAAPAGSAALGFTGVTMQNTAGAATASATASANPSNTASSQAYAASATAGTRASASYSDYTDDIRIYQIPDAGIYPQIVNRRFTHTSGSWKAVDEAGVDAPVWLTATPASFFAWTPAVVKLNEGMSYPDSTSVELSPAIATADNDLAYAPVMQVSAQNPFTALKLRRAYAKITIKAEVDATYPGTPDITQLSIDGVSGMKAVLNLETGQYTYTDVPTPASFDASAGLVGGTTPATGILVLVPPMESRLPDAVAINCTLDGHAFTGLETAITELTAGTNYVVTLRVSGTGITLHVTTDDWNPGAGQIGVMEEFSLALKVDQNGILTVEGKMLFFQFGSVVGFTQEGAWDADKVLFNPVTGSPSYTDYLAIPVYETADFVGSPNVSDSLYHKGTNIKAGKGDPCKLVGLTATQIQTMTAGELDAYNSDWRLPTNAENQSFTGQTMNVMYSKHWISSIFQYHDWYYSNGSAGGYFPMGKESDMKNYLPAAGNRNMRGSTDNVGMTCHYWSSEANSGSFGHYMYFDSSHVYPLNSSNYTYGFGARCVREPVLEVDQNGILTAGGKMLFFQFGSVVGFTQEGTWDADKVLFNPVTDSSYTDYGSIPCYTADDWGVPRRNISDPAYHNGTNVKAGRGDPCKLVGLSAVQIRTMTAEQIDAYDSGWSIATKEEQFDFTGQTESVTYTEHWTASDSRYDKLYYSTGSAGGYFPMDEESEKKNYLPAAGHRNAFGSPFNEGITGSYWSNEAYNETTGRDLSFAEAYVRPLDNKQYTFGLGARCIRR